MAAADRNGQSVGKGAGDGLEKNFRLNFELNLSVFDIEFADTLNSHFDEVLKRSRQISLAEIDARGLPERLRDGVARLFSPYL